ncbi:IMEF encapsulin system ferritin-like cargo protein [Aneurinibacillus tyrosinisolvens]|uniref:IMEF encapsulin system ferritin-like cargo protein n=1 Tax=Aneurinibacillus tyrosinisolvens TaxID=1443435 RepID=UPI00063FD08C|nr:IMEF encapsulin system ferritin-like cargo protein [Aneurinibacillus tyrosinisolvens]
MIEHLSQLHPIFERTRNSITVFMDMLSPTITQAQDEHERLYFHHIYEEEEQRLERLHQLIPALSHFLENEQTTNITNQGFIHLLQDINLEKFGLHNFLEHLDLAMYHFKDEEHTRMLTSMLQQTKADYLLVKDTLSLINESFPPAVNSETGKGSEQHDVTTAAHDSAHTEHTPVIASPVSAALSTPTRKGLSVGSLKSAR